MQITSMLVGHLLTRLEVEAAKQGGSLDTQALRDIAQKFLAEEMPHFHSSFQRNYDECSHRRDDQRWSSVRNQPFERIITHKFAHLFAPRRGDDGDQGILSRRLMPGFTLAITKMIGPTLFDQCQLKARAIMQRHPTGTGGWNWHGIYADPECLALGNDVLVVVAHYFSDFDRRRNWFMALINSNLSPVRDDEDLHPNWQLGHHGFVELMQALFADLQRDLTTQPQKFLNRYGEQTAQAIGDFTHHLRIAM